LRAPFDGMVVEKHLALGESVKEDANVFTISDPHRLGRDEHRPKDCRKCASASGHRSIDGLRRAGAGTVAYVGALLGEQTRTARARVTLANPQGCLAARPVRHVEVLGSEQAKCR
jgi:cobalt-zinc-cadmium efflux system membrane fusion protein